MDHHSTLIFPGGMPLALSFLQECLREKRNVIGAYSLTPDPVQAQYPTWLSLPYLGDEQFDNALSEAITAHSIDTIYTPHAVVWSYLNQTLPRIAPQVQLVNECPQDSTLNGYRTAKQLILQQSQKPPLQLVTEHARKPDLNEMERISLFYHAQAIPGMCDYEKMHALYEIARCCPSGDLVEIGSWWGKSAFILLRLSQCFGIGNLLCVDPWSDAHLIQNDKNGLVDKVSAQYSAEEAFEVFQINLQPYSKGDINYLRLPSTEGARRYQEQPKIESRTFGITPMQGKIALLHIDGNHSYENAKADIAAWTGLVMPGGWVIIDDYTWPFGDGPQRAADEYTAANRKEICNQFTTGGALFIQLKD